MFLQDCAHECGILITAEAFENILVALGQSMGNLNCTLYKAKQVQTHVYGLCGERLHSHTMSVHTIGLSEIIFSKSVSICSQNAKSKA